MALVDELAEDLVERGAQLVGALYGGSCGLRCVGRVVCCAEKLLGLLSVVARGVGLVDLGLDVVPKEDSLVPEGIERAALKAAEKVAQAVAAGGALRVLVGCRRRIESVKGRVDRVPDDRVALDPATGQLVVELAKVHVDHRPERNRTIAHSSDQDLSVTDVTGDGVEVDVATNLLNCRIRLSQLWTQEIYRHPMMWNRWRMRCCAQPSGAAARGLYQPESGGEPPLSEVRLTVSDRPHASVPPSQPLSGVARPVRR